MDAEQTTRTMDRLLERVEVLPVIQQQVGRIEAKLDKLNGTVGSHEARLAVLEEWKRCLGEPAAKATYDLKAEVAKFGAMGAAAGTVLGLITLLQNLFGG